MKCMSMCAKFPLTGTYEKVAERMLTLAVPQYYGSLAGAKIRSAILFTYDPVRKSIPPLPVNPGQMLPIRHFGCDRQTR